MPGKQTTTPTETDGRAIRPIWLIPAASALALLLIYAGFCGAAASRRTIVPHTRVVATEVGGLTREQAAERIGGALDTFRRENGVRVTLEDGTEAAYLSYDALGVGFDADALADDAYWSSHSGNLIADGWTLLCAVLGRQTEITPTPAEGWTVGAARRLAEAAAREPLDFSYTVDDAGRLLMTKERDGLGVDVNALRGRLARTDGNGTRAVELPGFTIPAKTGDLAAVNAALAGGMANASYDKETGAIVPEHISLHFDTATAQSVLDAAAPGETVSIPAEVSMPEITAEELGKVLFRDVLGSYTTKVKGSAGRRSNVRLTAERVDGTVLNSGEEFNYYALTGPFTAANGYQSAPGYLHGKTVDMDGGGACQCSSTTYAAALYANLEIVARTAHGFASDYIGLGLDATVSGGGPDFIFRNNTPYPIKISADYSGNDRLTVTIVGTKTDETTVKIRQETLSKTPYEEEVVTDPSLAPGERVVDTTGYVGYLVNTYRQLYDGDRLISETFEARSKYNKRNKIVKVGPSPAETPVVNPSETPAENPEESETVETQTPVEVPPETPPGPEEIPIAGQEVFL